jgi:predicted metalloendopeptidase
MQTILAWIGGTVVVFVIGFLGGAHWESKRNQAEHAAQVVRLEARIADANKAMQMQRQLAGAYLAQMEKLATAPAPPNSNTAFDEAAAKRIGAIR